MLADGSAFYPVAAQPSALVLAIEALIRERRAAQTAISQFSDVDPLSGLLAHVKDDAVRGTAR